MTAGLSGNPGAAPGTPSMQLQIGATDDQRFFTKKRLTQSMLREYLSWLGLFTTTKDVRNVLSDLHA